MKPNPVVWFEIYVQDMSRAQAFYEAVFQCKLEPLSAPEGEASDYQMLAFPGDMTTMGAAGTLCKMEGAPSGGGGTLVYFGCDDGYLYALGPDGRAEPPKQDLHLEQVRSPLGGPLAGPENDWFTNFGNWANTNATSQPMIRENA